MWIKLKSPEVVVHTRPNQTPEVLVGRHRLPVGQGLLCREKGPISSCMGMPSYGSPLCAVARLTGNCTPPMGR